MTGAKNRILPDKPVLILMYGLPGSGKTHFARQFCEVFQAAHLEHDRIRFELFDQPRYTKQENSALTRIMEYMTNEFLTAGISVIYDLNAMRVSQRRSLRELARQKNAATLLIWFQIDADTSFIRNERRDRRKNDDRYAVGYSVEAFKQVAAYMQHPEPTEDFVVVSGKHTYSAQQSAVFKKLSDMRIIKPTAAAHRMIKPELVNLVPNQQPAEPGKPHRRNIVLR